jgi:hypothetical protein
MKSKNAFFPSLRSGHRLFRLCSVLTAAGASPSMAQTTWTGTSAGNWSDSARWNNGVPNNNAATISVAAPVTLNTAVPSITTLLTSNGAQLTIQDGASLTSSGLVRIGQSGARATLDFTGGALTTGEARVGSDSGTATANFSGGTWNASSFKVGTVGSVLNLSGAAHLNVTSGLAEMRGTIHQTGGTFTNGNNNLLITGGTYNISGGTFRYGATNLTTRDFLFGAAGGTLRVIGSSSSVTLSRNMLSGTGASDIAGNLVFAFDNSANHITRIQSHNSNTQRTVHLGAELRGGVLLSGTNSYDVWEAPSFSTTTGHGFLSTPDNLWTTSIAADVNGTRDAIRLQLAAGQLRGNADAVSTNALSFAAAKEGYVTLSSVDLSQPLTLALDITGGTLSNFTNALTAANILWSEGSDDYEVHLHLNPGISGGNYFAWDFSSFDPDMRLQGLTVIPEPSPTLLVAAGLIATAMFRRRRV